MASEVPNHHVDNQVEDHQLRSILDRFERSWDVSTPNIDAYYDTAGKGKHLKLLSKLIKIDLERRFRRGERPTAAEYFGRFPELAADDERTLSLIYEEFCFLEENDLGPRVSDFCRRYSRWSDSLVSQLAYHQHLSQFVRPRSRPRFPEEGERFASYKLEKLLGVGGLANVYLATDDLGGREVVLKVSEASSIGQEPSILAQIDHDNIVPIFTIADEPRSGLRGICMPYRPGVALDAFLEKIGGVERPRKASIVRDLLNDHGDQTEVIGKGWDRFPSDGTFHEAVSWIGLSMANALTYLERKGILHRDIKPANIWLSYRDGPLLFDFNLAYNPSDAECARKALRGGTLPYMAPEQLSAFLDDSKWARVQGPADIYSLGLVLREMITGSSPQKFDAKTPLTRVINAYHDLCRDRIGSIRDYYPEVPPSLDAIIGKCLAFRVEDRYQRPASLAEDLTAFLDRRPLVHAGNPSRLEALSNWLHRNGKQALLSVSFCFSLMFVGLLIALWSCHSGPIQQNNMFRRAVADLDSPDRDRWILADSAFDRLEKQYPLSAWPILYKAIARQQLGRENEAESEYKRLQSFDDALDVFQHRLSERAPSAPFLAAMGWFLKTKGRLEDSNVLLDQATHLAPDNEWVWFIQGSILKERHLEGDAILAFRRAIRNAKINNRAGTFPDFWRDACTFSCIDQMVFAIDDQFSLDRAKLIEEALKNLTIEAKVLREDHALSENSDLLIAVEAFLKAGQAWRSIQADGVADDPEIQLLKSCLMDLKNAEAILVGAKFATSKRVAEHHAFFRAKTAVVEGWIHRALNLYSRNNH